MKADRDDPQSFSREQCLALVASVSIGRVVYTDQALPAVVPMNFVLDGDEVVIHTGSGSTLAAAIRNAVVAFQVDDFDSDTTTGWSVTITGRARLVDGGEEATGLARLPLRPWVPTKNGQFIRIPARHVGGHRLGPCVLVPVGTQIQEVLRQPRSPGESVRARPGRGLQ
jgi:nitroimidazol reductase NimA-like FMN-containing flavoprotein (pyridoxamine 5'-phosphate oxidase superfamily)